ncbi:hypothetical protein D3C85_1108980 [compost metagenome]
MTAPPSAAPSALPRLKAPTLMDEANPGASAAASITRICRGGTNPKVATPQTSKPSAAATWLVKARGNSNMMTASAARKIRVEPSSDQSARRPPRLLPRVKPTPIRTSASVTKASEAPVRSASTGAT